MKEVIKNTIIDRIKKRKLSGIKKENIFLEIPLNVTREKTKLYIVNVNDYMYSVYIFGRTTLEAGRIARQLYTLFMNTAEYRKRREKDHLISEINLRAVDLNVQNDQYSSFRVDIFFVRGMIYV